MTDTPPGRECGPRAVRSPANMADKRTLGELIRDRRVGLDIGLRELARRLGVTPSYVSDIENNRRVPSEEVLHGIARELGLDFDDLAAYAGRIGAEAERYLRETPAATTLFRRISEEKLTDEEVQGLLEKVKDLRPETLTE